MWSNPVRIEWSGSRYRSLLKSRRSEKCIAIQGSVCQLSRNQKEAFVSRYSSVNVLRFLGLYIFGPRKRRSLETNLTDREGISVADGRDHSEIMIPACDAF